MRAITTTIAIAFGLVACTPVQSPSQQGSASMEQSNPVLPSTLTPESQAASSAVTSPHAELTEAQFDAWRKHMNKLCASGDRSLKIEHFDVNDDQTADTICWRILETKDQGKFIDLQARVIRAGKTQTAYIILPFSGGTYQVGICEPSDAIVVRQGRWTRQIFEEIGWDYIGPVSINIEGTDCDPPWLFWPIDAKDDVVEFTFARM